MGNYVAYTFPAVKSMSGAMAPPLEAGPECECGWNVYDVMHDLCG
jgi:hypothetical protein